MQTFKIRIYCVRQETPSNALFILSRGKNAGKPMFEPCPNCYIIYCRNRVEVENLYWTIYTLWKNRFFRTYLCGSVIEMLRIYEFSRIMRDWIIPAFSKIEQNEKILRDLKNIYRTEQKITKQLELLAIYRDALVQKYYYKI